MTDGHKHRMLKVSSFDTPLVRLLRKPLRHSRHYAAVDASPYPYGPCHTHTYGRPGEGKECWVLTPLGILHRWTGLTLRTPE